MNNSRGESIRATETEMQQLIDDSMASIKEIAMYEINTRAYKSGMGNGELYDSFKIWAISEAKSIVNEIYISFNKYGRYKDMRYVNPSSQVKFKPPNNRGKKYKKGGSDSEAPPLVIEMKEWIERNGGLNLKVNARTKKDTTFRSLGYDNSAGKFYGNTRAIMRLAWTMAANRMQTDKVRNKRSIGWYNTAKSMMATKIAAELRKRIRNVAKDAVKNSLETIEIKTKI